MLFSRVNWGENNIPHKTLYTPRAPKNKCMPTEVWKKHAPGTQASRHLLIKENSFYKYIQKKKNRAMDHFVWFRDGSSNPHKEELRWSNTVSNANELFQSYVKADFVALWNSPTTLLAFSKFSLEEWKWNWYILGRLLYISCLDSAHISNALGLNLSCWSIQSWNVIPHDRHYSMDLIYICSVVRTQNDSKILMSHSADW